jgi:hypothetical protein
LREQRSWVVIDQAGKPPLTPSGQVQQRVNQGSRFFYFSN